MNSLKLRLSIVWKFSLYIGALLLISILLFACSPEDHTHDYEPLIISPTCEAPGYEGEKCKTCDAFQLTKILEKLTHSYSLYQKATTCEEYGYLANICEKCGDMNIIENTDPTNHNFVLQELIIEDANIDQCGIFECKNCGDKINKQITYSDVNMPILSLNGSMAEISKENKITISVSYQSEQTTFDCDATLKLQGASSLSYPKKNFNIEFLKTGTTSKNKVLLNESWGKQSKYTLKANWIDYSQSRNVVSGKIFSQIVHSRNLEDEVSNISNGGVVDGTPILIYHNGNFHGLYTLNIPKDKWMFGMEDDEENDDIVTKQAAIATGSWDAQAYLTEEIADYSNSIELEFCSTEDTIGTTWVLESFNNMIRFINNSTDEEFKQNISNYIDLQKTIDGMIYTSVILGGDNIVKNIMWLTFDGQHWFSSMYDMDGTWGISWSGNVKNEYCDNIVSETSGNKLWKRIYSLYKEDIAKRYFSLRTNILSLDNIKEQFTAFNNKIPNFVREAEKQKWTTVPSQETNNLEQIFDFATIRLAYLDNLMLSYL